MYTSFKDKMVIMNFLFWLLLATSLVSGSPVYNVVDYGAKGDSQTDDSQTFIKAWEAACNDPNSPTIVVPASRTFLLGPTNFQGPCKSPIHLQIETDGRVVAPSHKWTDKEMDYWIAFRNVGQLTFDGSGFLDGQGSIWWDSNSLTRVDTAPRLIGIVNCQDVTLSGLNINNSPGKHIAVHSSTGVHIDWVTITSPQESPNTDGIIFTECEHVQVSNSTIGTGDDCIAVGKGTSDVTITQVTCGPGHGISVGGLGSQGSEDTAENIWVQNCNLSNTMYGVRIKTFQGGSGYARNITFKDIYLNSVEKPIIIDQYYCNGFHNCQNSTSAVQVSDVTFSNVVGTSKNKVAVHLACSKDVACTEILMQDVNVDPIPGLSGVKSYCLNAQGHKSGFVEPDVPCLSG